MIMFLALSVLSLTESKATRNADPRRKLGTASAATSGHQWTPLRRSYHAAAAAPVVTSQLTSQADDLTASESGHASPHLVMVQHWHCEVRDAVRTNKNDQTFGSFVVTVSPVFPEVRVDADPEFNAIHQRRANQKQVAEFVRFLQLVMGERKMAMAAGNLKESEEEVLLLLWADRQWSWLDEVGRNELQVLTSEEIAQMSEQFHVVLVGDPVPHWGESRLKPSRNQGFERLVRVLEELSHGNYYIRLHEIPGAANDGSNAKRVQIFR